MKVFKFDAGTNLLTYINIEEISILQIDKCTLKADLILKSGNTFRCTLTAGGISQLTKEFDRLFEIK